ncbi:nucleoside-diphosphate kinase [Actinomadura rupiterrae]|uniref:nucleoside-diphosphate kinase n=1 Tax=Actinomadura rupiterrae TaxID=559627 RepID=UPI0020A38079|nr:nucleoside-diphosphate kinase [Actinomadura rupiterrae]MCP2342968.1 nucleoside-diphosphate kinase [Actinomadura rupiterrae]
MAGGVDWTRWSVIYLKPDCVARGLVPVVLTLLGQQVSVHHVRSVTVTQAQIFAHYDDLFSCAALRHLNIDAELRRMHVGQRAVIALGHGPDAPARLRDLIGPTDPATAPTTTIRGRYGIDSLAAGRAENRLIDNLIHTSDDPAAARRDFGIWYGDQFRLLSSIADADRHEHPDRLGR